MEQKVGIIQKVMNLIKGSPAPKPATSHAHAGGAKKSSKKAVKAANRTARGPRSKP